MKKLFLFLIPLLLFLGFSSASSLTYNLNTTASSMCVFKNFLQVTQPLYLDSLSGDTQVGSYLLTGDLFLVYSGSTVLQTGVIQTLGTGTTPFVVTFSGLLLYPVNSYHLIIVLTGGARTIRQNNNQNYDYNTFKQAFAVTADGYQVSCTLGTFPTTAPNNLGVYLVKTFNYTLTTINNCTFTGVNITYSGGNYFSTGNVSLSGSCFNRNGTNFNYCGTSGVNLYWTDYLDNSVLSEFYTKSNLYLSGKFVRTFTGGINNYSVYGLPPFCVEIPNNVYTITGLNVDIVESLSYTGNVYWDFYKNMSYVLASNWVFIVISIVGVVFFVWFIKLFRIR